MVRKIKITDEFLMGFLGKDSDQFSYAIQPYTCIEEYQRDNNLMGEHNTSTNPQDKFLIIMAAKLERTDGLLYLKD